MMRLRALARIAALCAVAAPVLRPAAALPASPSIQVFVEPGAHVAPVLSLIRSARRTLRLEVYLLTDRSVVAELARARGRGVDVRVLLEEHPFEGSRYAQLGYNALHQAGVPVRWANEGAFRYTHEKALEVDERLAGILTLNLTSSGIFRNREFGVLDASSEDA
ncbi:MAG: hypothetical protein JOZ41_15230, partial [Chloroflexi bacterium]|nr:hypothetical protein [Chloroflexota bacterium]